MEPAAFTLKSSRTCSGINRCQHAVATHTHTQKGESAKARGIESEWMLTAFKAPVGILCHCILSPQLLASTISHRSVYVFLSPSLSEWISHPLLPQLLAASFLILSSISLLFLPSYVSSPNLQPFTALHFSSFPDLFKFSIFSRRASSTSCVSSSPFRFVLFCFFSISSRSLAARNTSSRLPTPCLTHGQERRSRIRCGLNLPAVKT